MSRVDPRHERTLEKIRKLARQMKAAAGVHGFAVFVFNLNRTDGTITYASNAVRADMIKAVRELLDRLEREGDT